MTALLLRVLAWTAKVPASTVQTIYGSAKDIVSAKETDAKVSGWTKLQETVGALVGMLPSSSGAIASTVVTIIVNVAVLVLRIEAARKGAAK